MATTMNYSGGTGQSSALADAVGWVVSLLTGTVGNIAATLAIAGIGFAMLQGRVSVRDGARVVVGCFVLFGAPVIARELLDLARWDAKPAPLVIQPSPAPIAVPSPPAQNRDPYAGASVPL